LNQLIFSNPCVRCGRERVVKSVKKERVDRSLVVTTITSCPDPECQKRVNRGLAVEKEKREKMASEFLQREKERKEKILIKLREKRESKRILLRN